MDLEHEKRITEVESRSKSNTKRIDNIEKRQDDLDELVGTVKALAVKEERVEKDVKEIKDDVKILTAKPAKRWEGIVDKFLYGLIGALAGYIATQIGL